MPPTVTSVCRPIVHVAAPDGLDVRFRARNKSPAIVIRDRVVSPASAVTVIPPVAPAAPATNTSSDTVHTAV